MPLDPRFQAVERDLGGRYQIVRPLGSGAFGAVYLARDVALHRLVAVKVLHNDRLDSPDERARFLREARTIGQLSHPGIVPLLTFGETESAVYMVMPHVGGESLADLLRREPRLDPNEARRILIEVVDALAHAHAHGVLHRDLKPENVLLENGPPGDDSPPRVRLIDFGVAAFPTRDPGVRASTETWGTLHFMAPEQAFGEPELDPRSDLYAIGVLGFLLLGGRLPFDAASGTERLSQQRKGPGVPLAICAPNTPRDLAAVINRCLAFDPEDRWARARDLRDALMTSLDGSSSATSSMAIVRQRQRGKRRPARQAPRTAFFDRSVISRAWFTGLGADLRFAVRGLRRFPAFSAAIIATLAIGLGATTVVFSLIDALVLRAPPVADPSRLVMLEERHDAGHNMQMGATAFSYTRFLMYGKALPAVFSGLAGQAVQDFSLRTGDKVRSVGGFVTSGSYFEVLGIHPALGRFYTAAQDKPGGAEPVVVIGYDFWQRELHGDSAVVGRQLALDSRPLTVIGVAPRGFHGAFAGVYSLDAWVPAATYRHARGSSVNSDGFSMVVFGRLRPDVTIPQADAAVAVASRQEPMEDPTSHVLEAWVEPLHLLTRDSRGGTVNFLTALFAIAAVVLVIAATNAAGMLLARGSIRGREITTRLAVGATRARVVRQLLVESVLLCSIAGALGLLITFGATKAFNAMPSPMPWAMVAGFGVNARVFGSVAVAMIAAGIFAGLAPAFHATRLDLGQALKAGGGRSGPQRARLRGAFVVGQIALAVTLLAMAGLFERSLQRVVNVSPGFDASGVVVGAISLRPHGYDDARAHAFVDQLLTRLRARPEIEAASIAAAPPLSGNQRTADARLSSRADEKPIDAQYTPAGVGLLELLRVPMIAGRRFTSADAAGSPRVGVVNEMLAHQLWPNVPLATVVGRRFEFDHEQIVVIGIVKTGKYLALQEAPSPFVFTSLAQDFTTAPTLFVRARGDEAAALRATRTELARLDPNIAFERSGPLADWVAKYVSGQRLGATLIAVFGLIGLTLSTVGIYGLLSFGVAQRSHEFGIRMALGAQAADVVRLVLNRAAMLVGIGIAVGLAGAIAAGRVVSSLLFGLSPTDPVTFIAVPFILGAAALLAAIVPVRRASRANPIVAMRAD